MAKSLRAVALRADSAEWRDARHGNRVGAGRAAMAWSSMPADRCALRATWPCARSASACWTRAGCTAEECCSEVGAQLPDLGELPVRQGHHAEGGDAAEKGAGKTKTLEEAMGDLDRATGLANHSQAENIRLAREALGAKFDYEEARVQTLPMKFACPSAVARGELPADEPVVDAK